MSAPSGSSQDLFPAKTKLEETIERAETDWQRAVLREWGVRNPKPVQLNFGSQGYVDWVPSLCVCIYCHTPALIIPDLSIAPERGYCICPRCSAQQQQRVTSA